VARRQDDLRPLVTSLCNDGARDAKTHAPPVSTT
jgi:hypothetical protein